MRVQTPILVTLARSAASRAPWPLSLAVIGVTVLLPSPAFAFRTAGELPEFSDTRRVRWAEPVVEFDLHSNAPPNVSPNDAVIAVSEAAQTWSRLACGIIIATRNLTDQPAQPGDGVNTIQWINEGWSALGFDPNRGAITDTQYARGDDGSWQIVEADIYLNGEDHQWMVGPVVDGYEDVRVAVTHELGHFIGLLHPCEPAGFDGAPACEAMPEAADTMMYPLYSPARVELSDDDVAGACYLYPPPTCTSNSCAEGEVCTDVGCLAMCGDLVCAPGEICDAGYCVNPADQSGTVGSVPAQPGSATDLAAGDPCSRHRDCQSRRCEDGYCARPCGSGEECLESQTCEATETAVTCQGPGLGFGEPCEHAGQCLGGECVAFEDDSTGSCTRSCEPPFEECPEGWSCADVDGERVCEKEQVFPGGGGGCAATSAPANANGSHAAVFFTVLVAMAQRNKKRRRQWRRP